MADPLDEALAPHVRRADRLVRDRMADARSHAHRGDLATAAQRLVDLHHALIGPAGTGAIGDARARFHADSYRLEPHDPQLHDPARMAPTREAAEAARSAPIGGIDAHRDLGTRVEQARAALAVATLGDPATRAARVDAWHARHEPALRSWAARTLSDSQVAIYAATQFLRLRPEFRGDR